jgi:hypothetical protein
MWWAILTLILVLAFALIAAMGYIAWRGYISERDMARRHHKLEHSVLTNDIDSNDVKTKGLSAKDIRASGAVTAKGAVNATEVNATTLNATDVNATSAVNASSFNLMSDDGAGSVAIGLGSGHLVAAGNVGAYGDVYARGVVAGSGGVVLSSTESPFAPSASTWAIRTDALGLSISHRDSTTGLTRASLQTTPDGNVVFPGKICDADSGSQQTACIDIRSLIDLAGKVDALLNEKKAPVP